MITDKLEVDASLVLSPSPYQWSVLRVFKASQSYTERREFKTRMRCHRGIVLGTSRTQGHALTNCATLAPSARAQASSVKRLSRALNHARGHFRLLPASLHGLSFSIQEIFACGIRDPELWDSEYNLLNPESRE